MDPQTLTHEVLVVAAVDPSGGAGVAADVRTVAAHGCHPRVAVTALTVQDASGLSAVYPVRPEELEAQIGDTVPAWVKCGALINAGLVAVVAKRLGSRLLVVDPVLRASAGGTLLDEPGLEALRDVLLPMTFMVTPNAHEAAKLAGFDGTAREMAEAILGMGVGHVVITGGDVRGQEVTDLYATLVDGDLSVAEITGERVETRYSHGTGCTFASAVTANLARGSEPLAAVQRAAEYVRRALRGADRRGEGAVQPPPSTDFDS